MTELVLKGGRVLDPGRGIDQISDVAFAGGRVRAIGPDLAVPAVAEVKDVRGRIVTPGLIDLHTRVSCGGTSLAVDPMSVCLAVGRVFI